MSATAQYVTHFYRGKEVAVLGSSDFALHEAEELSHTASRVTIFTDGKKPEFSRENQLPVNTMKIQAIEGDERVSGIRLKSDVSMQEQVPEKILLCRQRESL